MIDYKPDLCGCNLLFNLKGSMYYAGLMWGVPSAIFTLAIHETVQINLEEWEGVSSVWVLFSGVLTFLVVFRTTQAYNRFWAGTTFMQRARGEWVAAVSNLFAFCSKEPEKAAKVDELRASIVSLVSMLFAQKLQALCTNLVSADIPVDVIGADEVDQTYIDFLASTESPGIVVLGWIEHVVMDAQEADCMRAAPPLLARAFSRFSSGMIEVRHASMLNDLPLPFPYEQSVQLMLVIQTVVFPVVSSIYISNPVVAAIMDFIVVCTFWQVVYIAREIDHPFGNAPNDLNIADLQKDINESLKTLMLPPSMKAPPKYKGHLLPRRAILRHQLEPTRDTFKFFAPELKRVPEVGDQVVEQDMDSFQHAASNEEVSVAPISVQMTSPAQSFSGSGREGVQSDKSQHSPPPARE